MCTLKLDYRKRHFLCFSLGKVIKVYLASLILRMQKRLVFVCTKIIDSCFEKEELYVTDKEIDIVNIG